VQFILRVETRARNVVHARPERLRSILQIRFRFEIFLKTKGTPHITVESAHVGRTTTTTTTTKKKKKREPYSVLELGEELTAETVEFAGFFESAVILVGIGFCTG
jgi:hypothetical protein